MKLNQVKKNAFNISIFIFIFTSINREFSLFGFDLRYLSMLMNLFIIIFSIINIKGNAIKLEKIDFSFIILYVFMAISNIMFLFNNIDIQLSEFLSLLILHSYNFSMILTVMLNKNILNKKMIYNVTIFSCIVLMFSIILLSLNINLSSIMNGYSGFVSGNGHYNFFGDNIRYAGFAQDPNYASLFLVVGLMLSNKINNIILRVIFIILSIFCFLLSWSKTIVVSILLLIIFSILLKIINKLIKTQRLNSLIKKIYLFLPVLIFIFLIISHIDLIKLNIQTLDTRFIMWNSAREMFYNSPIIGNGLGSFRFFFAQNGGWLVQAHSTYWQILSEIGLIGSFVFCYIYYLNFLFNKKQRFLILIILFIGLNFELLYLQIFPLVYYIYFIAETNDFNKTEKNALFFVNSFGLGGAERVCDNLAKDLVVKNYKVHFITLYKDNDYAINSNYIVHNADLKKSDSSIKKIIKIVLFVTKVNKITSETNFDLITSHLPMSNILTLISNVSGKSIYVIHSNLNNNIEGKFKFILKYAIRILLNNKKVVCVSDGLRISLIENGILNKYNTYTIYNPINYETIQQMSNEYLELDRNYILFVGRLEYEKRPELLLDIFNKSNLKNDFDLIYLGDGSLRENLERKIVKYGLERSVKLLGYNSNVYKYMKHATILVNTSYTEAFPMVMIEAISVGCRVVAGDINFGPREILINNNEKYLVNDPNSIDEYLEVINSAIYHDDEVDKEIVNKCLINNIVNEYLYVYNYGGELNE